MPDGGELQIEASNVLLSTSDAARRVALEPGRYVRLRVRDTGQGMSGEVAARVFEPFFTTKEQGKGTGLGLSIVYGIVTHSGGDITVSSSPEGGTSFEILLPAVEGDAGAAPRAQPDRLVARGETILVVEDEAAVRAGMSRILSRAGYEVLVAANAGEALLISERRGEGIDLLLTDVVMPQVSGKELAERLRTWLPGLRVLFTSGYASDVVGQRGVLTPDTPLLEKPFTHSSLLAAVRRALDSEERIPARSSWDGS
jgi:CheY-like chemotaxis protein